MEILSPNLASKPERICSNLGPYPHPPLEVEMKVSKSNISKFTKTFRLKILYQKPEIERYNCILPILDFELKDHFLSSGGYGLTRQC